MKAKMRHGATTIAHPVYGEVEWIDTNKTGDRIQIKYYSARHGEHLSEWIDWTIPVKEKKSGSLEHLYGREVSQVSFVFERLDGARLFIPGVEHTNIFPHTIVAFPSRESFPLIDLFFNDDDVASSALYGYVEGWDKEVPIYSNDDELDGAKIGVLKINCKPPEDEIEEVRAELQGVLTAFYQYRVKFKLSKKE